jgi:hypothetical protein
MNLERKSLLAVKCAARLFFQRRRTRLGEIFFGQTGPARLESDKPFMSLLLFARRAALCFCWGLAVGIPAAVFAQTNYYTTNGTEYAIIGSLPGDQVCPDAALNSSGGFAVWQDNITDGSGWGISATRLDTTLNPDLTWSDKRVNVRGADDQENPRVAMLKNGGAAFVWQGGRKGSQQIYARFLTSTNTWLTTDDVLVNTPPTTNVLFSYIYATNTTTTVATNYDRHHHITGYTTNTTTTVATTVITNVSLSGSFRINPAVATLTNGNVVVVWASFDEVSPNSLLDVYGQVFSPAGRKIAGEFLINQFISYNQRTPAVAALANGGFVVAWVSEQERKPYNLSAIDKTNGTASTLINPAGVDIYARFYNSDGVAQSDEKLVDTGSNPCANPSVAAAADGSFMIAWGARDLANPTNSWDIYARTFSSAGVGGAAVRVNSCVYGDQFAPRISAVGGDYLIVWTSLGQDGSREGVYGQFVHEDGSLVGGEFRVNTTTVSSQMQPVVASDGAQQFLVIWTSFTGNLYSFDLYAQRYANVAAVLQPMSAPFIYAPFMVSNDVYQPQLQVSWSAQQGIPIADYEVYVDGASTPMVLTTNNVWTMTAANGLAANSTHSFQLSYVTTDGRRPQLLSAPASGKTWNGCNYYGIPCEWMLQYFGNSMSSWPSVTADSDGDGMNNYQEFLAGTNPTNSASVLSVRISKTSLAGQQPNQAQLAGQTPTGMYLIWNTQPGLTYQVQMTTDFVSWSNLGSPRFAAENSDSIYVGSGAAGYYRVLLLRQ